MKKKAAKRSTSSQAAKPAKRSKSTRGAGAKKATGGDNGSLAKTTSKATAKKRATKKRGAKKSGSQRGAKASRARQAVPRELIDTGSDKRYVRRNSEGQFDDVVDVGRSLAQDRQRQSKRVAKRGQGDKGDRRPSKKKKG